MGSAVKIPSSIFPASEIPDRIMTHIKAKKAAVNKAMPQTRSTFLKK
ncbi:MAG: hypothetical protein ABFD11_00850 [Christensenella sp.]